MDLICFMWECDPRGKITDTIPGFMRMCGASREDLEAAFKEFMSRRVCQVERDNHGSVTVISRRISREEKQRELARLRKQKEREKENVTDESREIHREKIEDRRYMIEDRKESSFNNQGESQNDAFIESYSKKLLSLQNQTLSKYGRQFNFEKFIRNNLKANKDSIILSIEKLLASPKEISNPEAYCQKIVEIESGNLNERQFQKEHSENIFNGLLTDLKKLREK